VATQEHRERLVCMGESPHRILVAGSVALDRFVLHRPLPAAQLRSQFPEGKVLDGYALLIFHPVDAESGQAGGQFRSILSALRSAGIPVCASFPNTDPGNAAIREAMAEHWNDVDCWFFQNLERDLFLSLYKGARFIIGNSSSGILEAASVPLPAINVGLRQRGRMAGPNVLFCEPDESSISKAIAQAESPAFRAGIAHIVNPYGTGNSCASALRFLLETDFRAWRGKTEDPIAIAQAWQGAGHGG
jgi:UDP-N-acetylglucosamine 2-epimerase (non-hydrolysing)/GDP/UDP-N,N'-diacetylbacillosamine 2-epimerase (hydrolysing)